MCFYNIILKRINKLFQILILTFCVLIGGACNEDEKNSIKEDPYSGGREPLTLKLLNEAPTPEKAGPGEEVIFQASGLLPYVHDGEYDFQFYISDQLCEIKAATDTTLTIVVPQAVSSGKTFLVMEGQIFDGPYFNVSGSVSVDDAFEYYKTGPIGGFCYACVPWSKNTALNTRFYLLGTFRQKANVTYGGLAMIDHQTGLLSRNSEYYDIYRGIETGYFISAGSDDLYQFKLRGMEYMKDGSSSPGAVIYGLFNTYEENKVKYPFANILLLKNTMWYNTQNIKFTKDDGSGGTYGVNVPTFNGGTETGEEVVRAFSTPDGKQVVAVGNFFCHSAVDYNSTYYSVQSKTLIAQTTQTEARSVMRMDEKGALDLKYRRDPVLPKEKSLEGVGDNGAIRDACMLQNGEIIIGGILNEFDGKQVNNLLKLKADGTLDETFLANIGTGVNGTVEKVNCASYKNEKGETVERIMVVGSFSMFNGVDAQGGVLMLRPDGRLDETFQLKEMAGGVVNFAKIVDLNATNPEKPKPHVVISGTFNKYDNVTRQGFLILDMDGNAIQQLNVPGKFTGELRDAQYSLTSDMNNGLLLVGDFVYFDGKRMNGIVMLKVTLKNE